LVHYKLGVWGNMSVDPATKEIAIEIRDQGATSPKMRSMHEEQLLKEDTGPAAQIDL